MNTYILILLCGINNGGGAFNVEFSSKNKCEIAGQIISENRQFNRWVNECRFICVEK